MKKCIFIIGFVLFLFSCDKKPETYVTGTVVEYGTYTPIPNARLSFIAGKSNGLFEPHDEWFLDTVRTDANGKFEFGTDEEASYFNIVGAKKDGFYPMHDPEFFYPGHEENFEIVLDPYAWLEIEAIDVDSIEGGSLSISGKYLKSYEPLYKYFNTIDKTWGNRYIYIYIKTDFLNHTRRIDSIYVEAQDTGFYQILY